MAAFRILDQNPAYLGLLGLIAAGGTLNFYDAGTTTPKDVFGDEALTVNNGPVLVLGPDGRAQVDVWGDGAYRVRLYDANATLIWDRDDVEIPGGTGTSIPSLQAGKYLTNDGALLLWQAIIQVPDPTGQSGKILGTDGVNPLWQSISSLNIPSFSAVPGGFQAGTLLIQLGSDSLPASGTVTSVKAVTFQTAFSAAPNAIAIAQGNSQPAGPVVMYQTSAPTVTGASFTGDIAEGNAGGANFTQPAPFQYIAIGTK